MDQRADAGLPSPTVRHPHLGRLDVLAIAILGLVAVGIPLWMSASVAAIGMPSLDDWVYMRGADALYRTGVIDMPGHTAAAVGQILMVQPLLWLSGGSPWAFTAFGLTMALVAVAATYLLARRFVGTGSAVLVVALVVLFPGFARLEASFMTDVPSFAFMMLSLLLGVRWLHGDGGRASLLGALAVGLVGVSIREFAIAAPIAILVAAWARNRVDERVVLLAMTGAFVVGVACDVVVAASIPGRTQGFVPDIARLGFLGPALETLAVILLPASALAMGRWMTALRPQQLLFGAALACLTATVPWGMIRGNLWMQDGIASDSLLSGTRDAVFSPGVWALAAQLATFATILFAVLALQWSQHRLIAAGSLSTVMARAIQVARSREAALILLLVAYAAELVVFASVWVYDRYLVPMIPAAAILLLRGLDQRPRLGRSNAFSHAAVAWLVIAAIAISANSFAYDAARWRTGEGAVAMGYDARTVDAGYEWVADHADGIRASSAPVQEMTWSGTRWALINPCAVVSNSPLDDASFTLIHVDRAAYQQYLFLGPSEPLYLYGVLTNRCPRPPAGVASTGAP